MSSFANVTNTLDIRTLEEVPAPGEPSVLYRETDLSSSNRLALIEGKSFFVANRAGDLMPAGAPHIGFFYHDTRFLSQLHLTINETDPTVLSSTTEGLFATKVELTAKGRSSGTDLDFPLHTVHVHREQLLTGNLLCDNFFLQNYHQSPTALNVELTFDVDFVDIFQVRGLIRGKSGRYFRPVASPQRMLFVYEGLDDCLRSTEIRFLTPPTKIENRTAGWQIRLEPGEQTRIVIAIIPRYQEKTEQRDTAIPANHDAHTPLHIATCYEDISAYADKKRERYHQWTDASTHFESDNEIFDQMLLTSVNDFLALQIPDREEKIVAAGIPWFATIFGRDSILASLQALILNPSLARDTLRVLARYQGKRNDPKRDEEPGKIVHEVRSGEMTATGEVAFGLNYGSVDATPLFLVLLGHYYDWTGDRSFVEEMLPATRKALDWIIHFSDLDDDSFSEYERKSPKGLFNQGWKDSGDANIFSDGSIAQPPLALIEVQGYVFDAFTRLASLTELVGTEEESRDLRERAERLRVAIDRHFWRTDMNYYAMALDHEKKPLDVYGSNPGHLLFSRAIEFDRAAHVVKHLMDSGLFSGWGIRTLSRFEKGFNPLSYHRGSVWPHDNSIIAYGMSRYGFQREASHLFDCLFHAALNFRDYRLPELFCGVQRTGHDEPVHYPVSCSPQAWASGTFFLLLTGLLGIRPNAAGRELSIVNPRLPESLNRMVIRNLRIGNSTVSLEYLRHRARTFCNVIDIEGDPLEVKIAFGQR